MNLKCNKTFSKMSNENELKKKKTKTNFKFQTMKMESGGSVAERPAHVLPAGEHVRPAEQGDRGPSADASALDAPRRLHQRRLR